MMTPRQLTDITRLVEMRGMDAEILAQLRQIYPGLYFTACLDDDINEVEPALCGVGVNVYLVDRRQHCLRLTEDFESASGVVLALVSDEVDA